jgi:hypothetical protein
MRNPKKEMSRSHCLLELYIDLPFTSRRMEGGKAAEIGKSQNYL